MSTKRTSPESSAVADTNNDSVLLLQQDDGAKRAKLTSLSDTTLQDLPPEIVECILVRSVAMEVEEMHLAKSVWKDKADLVINRLSSVCPDWSNILTTNFFQNELHRTLARTAEKTIRLEILHQSPSEGIAWDAITLQDEFYVLCRTHNVHAINVYDRINLTQIKDVIQLPGTDAGGMVACSVSKCLYVLDNKTPNQASVLRITKDDGFKFNISPLISARWIPSSSCLSVTANGGIILSEQNRNKKWTKIVLYDAHGSSQHTIRLSSDLYGFSKILPKSSGNLILVSTVSEKLFMTKLTEIDMNGTILRHYQSLLMASWSVCEADRCGRILIFEQPDRIELIDSEFNLLKVIFPQLDENLYSIYSIWHYNSDRNEVSTVLQYGFNPVLHVLHITEA